MRMSSLLSKYCQCLENKGIKAESYSKQRLKLRLENHFGENIVFHQHPDKRKPEVIYSSNISLQDVLNAAAAAQNARTRSESNVSDDAQQIVKTQGAHTTGATVDLQNYKGLYGKAEKFLLT